MSTELWPVQRGLGRYFVRAFVRRFAYGVAALLFAAVLHMCAASEARAATDKGEAYYGCMKRAIEQKVGSIADTRCNPNSNNTDVKGDFSCQKQPTGSTSWIACSAPFFFPYTVSCTNRNVTYPPGDVQPSTAQPASTCYGGCKVAGTPISNSSGGITLYGMLNRYYTGESCFTVNNSNAPIVPMDESVQETTQPKTPECTALGSGQTACLKPNGDHCTTASTGKTFCWTPTETGKKVDGVDAQVKSPKGDAVTPPSLVVDDTQEWQRKEGHQLTACVNNTCTTYNVTNYSSVAKGTAKNSTGDNNADGSGNTSGNGSSSGTKKGDDESKDSASDSGNCDTPPICVGDTLKCLQLKFTWKIQCNTQGNEITNGNGCGENDVPVCAGKSCKAEAYAQVIQQWKQRCAMEALGQGNAERAAGISNGDDAGVVEGIWGGESGGSGMTLRQDLVSVGGGGGSLLPDVEIEGQHWNVPQGFYDAIAAVRMVIIAMCTVIAMFVVGRNI